MRCGIRLYPIWKSNTLTAKKCLKVLINFGKSIQYTKKDGSQTAYQGTIFLGKINERVTGGNKTFDRI